MISRMIGPGAWREVTQKAARMAKNNAICRQNLMVRQATVPRNQRGYLPNYSAWRNETKRSSRVFKNSRIIDLRTLHFLTLDFLPDRLILLVALGQVSDCWCTRMEPLSESSSNRSKNTLP